MMGIVNVLLSGLNIEINQLVIQTSHKISQLICFNAQSHKTTENILMHRDRSVSFSPDYIVHGSKYLAKHKRENYLETPFT